MSRSSGVVPAILAGIAASLLFPLTIAAGDDAGDLLKRLEKKYHSIDNIAVEFTQEVHYGVTGAEQSFHGTMVMKKGNNYRIELEDQTIVTDGISVWSYTKSNNQVIIDQYKETPESFSPDRIMVDVPARYAALVLGHEQLSSIPTTILKLTPKDARANLRWMKVWVDEDEYLMRKIQVLDVSDNLTTYTLDRISLNQAMNKGQFKFQAPPGTECIDLR